MNDYVNIRVSVEVKDWLFNKKIHRNESYSDVIKRLIEDNIAQKVVE